MRGALLPTTPFSEAKSRLSDLMTEVVHRHYPRLVDRHRGKEAMLLMSPDDLARFLSSYRFEPRVIFDEGEVTVRLPRFGLMGGGATLDEALEDLVEVLEAYTWQFFERLDFHMQTDRAELAPWLLRFAITPAEERLALLAEAPI